jgi:serine/threonine protein kinase
VAPPPPLFSNGSLLAGRFRILRRIGEGGMGVVYEAYDVERQMLVALKCITHPDPTAIFRFKREFRTLADISHPNLVSLYELVSDGEQWFFTMELVEGTDLARYLRPPSKLPEVVALEEMKTQSELGSIVEREAAMHAPTAELKRRPDPQREATKRPSSDAWDWSLVDFRKVRDVFAQLASAVQALHEANRLHRDLKPSNVLVRPNGAVVVLDFGLVAELERADAELRADPSAIESPGSNEEDGRAVLSDEIVTGTIPYMAPEQVTGEPLTTACDWYALGVMLYQVCTGRLPHEGAPSKILANKVTVKPIAPRAINPATPADLDALCMHLLAQRPTDRPNAVEILERLRSKRSSHRLSFEFDLSKRLFIGRAPQLSELAASYARSREGRAVVCSLRGAHGSGKTALIEHAMRTTLTGATVLRGRCFEHETVPLKTIDGVIDAMLRHVTTLTTPEAEALVPEGVAALVAMFPVLARSAVFARAAHDRPAPEALSELRSMAVDALRSLMFELARSKPLVIVIDDVHWGDVDGVRALSRLWDPPTIPMLTVLAYRPELEGASPALIELSKQRSGRPELPWSDVDLREFSR